MDNLEEPKKDEIDILSIPQNYIENRVKETCNKLITDDQLMDKIISLLDWYLLQDENDFIIVNENGGCININNKCSSDFIDDTLIMINNEFATVINEEVNSISIDDINKSNFIDNTLKYLLIESGGEIILHNIINYIGSITKMTTMNQIKQRMINNTF